MSGFVNPMIADGTYWSRKTVPLYVLYLRGSSRLTSPASAMHSSTIGLMWGTTMGAYWSRETVPLDVPERILQADLSSQCHAQLHNRLDVGHNNGNLALCQGPSYFDRLSLLSGRRSRHPPPPPILIILVWTPLVKKYTIPLRFSRKYFFKSHQHFDKVGRQLLIRFF